MVLNVNEHGAEIHTVVTSGFIFLLNVYRAIQQKKSNVLSIIQGNISEGINYRVCVSPGERIYTGR